MCISDAGFVTGLGPRRESGDFPIRLRGSAEPEDLVVLGGEPCQGFGDPRVQALAGGLCTTLLAATGVTNKGLRALMTGMLGGIDYTTNRASYDLGRLRVNGLITRIPNRNLYRRTDDGLRFAIFFTKVHYRLQRPLLATDQPPAPLSIRKALQTVDIHITQCIDDARLLPIAA